MVNFMRKIYVCIFVIMLIILIVLSGCVKKEEINEENKFKIVTSFYPLYIMTLNITDGIEDVTVSNMTDNNVGCLHNYSLQAKDLKKLSRADLFITNGLGIETFLDKIKEEYKGLEIIETSTVELDLIKDSEGINGHIWNDLDNYIEQVEVILNTLCAENPENTEKYTENAENYMKKLNILKQNSYMAKEKKTVISCNEALAYILNDVNVQTLEVYTEHEESALSSEKLKEVIEEAKQSNVKAIFIEKNDDRKVAELLEKETGAEIYELDASLTGNMDKDAYINAMTNNYKILRECLE